MRMISMELPFKFRFGGAMRFAAERSVPVFSFSLLLLAGADVSACAARAQATNAGASATTASSTSSSTGETNRRLLAAHNMARASAGVPPLTWSSLLADDAGRWAAHLASTGGFDHDDAGTERKHQGENLWKGTRGAYTLEQMIGAWASEVSDYRVGIFPNVSKSGNWESVGHYTQLIWRNTTHVGCAIATTADDQVLVCRYSPPGNYDGERP